MPKDSNFFEEAMALCHDTDPNVAQLAEIIYRAMLAGNQHRGLLPQGSFNILYFVQAVIRVWLAQRPDVALREDTNFPQSSEPINGVHWPEAEAGRNPIAKHFVKLVRTESVSTGDPLDVAYAVKVIESIFDDEGELRRPLAQEMNAEEFDYWLSGFNRKQP